MITLDTFSQNFEFNKVSLQFYDQIVKSKRMRDQMLRVLSKTLDMNQSFIFTPLMSGKFFPTTSKIRTTIQRTWLVEQERTTVFRCQFYQHFIKSFSDRGKCTWNCFHPFTPGPPAPLSHLFLFLVHSLIFSILLHFLILLNCFSYF